MQNNDFPLYLVIIEYTQCFVWSFFLRILYVIVKESAPCVPVSAVIEGGFEQVGRLCEYAFNRCMQNIPPVRLNVQPWAPPPKNIDLEISLYSVVAVMRTSACKMHNHATSLNTPHPRRVFY